jgi:hypothetical protein
MDDGVCESCGINTKKSILSEPFSYRSFYGLKERFILKLSYLERRNLVSLDFSSEKYLRYKKNLERRLSDIILGLKIETDLSFEKRRFFYLEAKEIVEELFYLNVSSDKVLALISDHSFGQTIAQELINYFSEAKNNALIRKSLEVPFLDRRPFGAFKWQTIIKFVISFSLLIYFSLVFF